MYFVRLPTELKMLVQINFNDDIDTNNNDINISTGFIISDSDLIILNDSNTNVTLQ